MVEQHHVVELLQPADASRRRCERTDGCRRTSEKRNLSVLDEVFGQFGGQILEPPPRREAGPQRADAGGGYDQCRSHGAVGAEYRHELLTCAFEGAVCEPDVVDMGLRVRFRRSGISPALAGRLATFQTPSPADWRSPAGSRERTLAQPTTYAPGVPDEHLIADVLASEEPFECQECHWQGKQRDLVRVENDDGSVEIACPRCEQAHWIFPT
jgi:hypothetical protein